MELLGAFGSSGASLGAVGEPPGVLSTPHCLSVRSRVWGKLLYSRLRRGMLQLTGCFCIPEQVCLE